MQSLQENLPLIVFDRKHCSTPRASGFWGNEYPMFDIRGSRDADGTVSDVYPNLVNVRDRVIMPFKPSGCPTSPASCVHGE
jgi:hypothetical protein